AKVQKMLKKGEITPEAIVTARAESISYGNEPYDATNSTPNYRCIPIDTLAPPQTASAILSVLE
ncbi:MAG: hypothetical protein ACOYL5_04390, partial [Phototrophicaceae bacterium]